MITNNLRQICNIVVYHTSTIEVLHDMNLTHFVIMLGENLYIEAIQMTLSENFT